MATPELQDKWAAYQDLGGLLIPTHIQRNCSQLATILDVGAGWGKYRYLLPYHRMDACEVWEPYVKENQLEAKYDHVYIMDILNFAFPYYDIVIFGDVLEHLTGDEAERVLHYTRGHCQQIYAVIPFEFPQGEVDGNPYEVHKQAELTDAIIREQYGLTLLGKDDIKGVYLS